MAPGFSGKRAFARPRTCRSTATRARRLEPYGTTLFHWSFFDCPPACPLKAHLPRKDAVMPASAESPALSLRHRLRNATTDAHKRVDSGFGGLNLRRPD